MSKEGLVNIFVSHHHSDAENIMKLKDLLKTQDTQMRDSSIYEDKAKNNAKNKEYIKSLLRPHIDWAGTILVLIGPKTSESDWVNWEVEYAAEHGKRIVGVFLRGGLDSDVPQALLENGNALIAWNSQKIDQAVNGMDIWENPEGTSMDNPIFPITRSSC